GHHLEYFEAPFPRLLCDRIFRRIPGVANLQETSAHSGERTLLGVPELVTLVLAVPALHLVLNDERGASSLARLRARRNRDDLAAVRQIDARNAFIGDLVLERRQLDHRQK